MESNLPCNKVKPLISAYYDNELSEKQTLLVKDHLEKCQTCNSEYEYMKKIGEHIRKSTYLPYEHLNAWQKIAPRLDETGL